MNELKPEDVMDILERMDFFQGQRAGRMLWYEKPFEVQEQDIADFSKGIAAIKAFIKVALALLREYKVKNEVLEEAKNQLEIDIINANMNLEHTQAEIERLTKELDGQFEKWKILADKTERHYGELYQEAKQVVRAEAVSVFLVNAIEKLREVGDLKPFVFVEDLYGIAKEMKEEGHGEK